MVNRKCEKLRNDDDNNDGQSESTAFSFPSHNIRGNMRRVSCSISIFHGNYKQTKTIIIGLGSLLSHFLFVNILYFVYYFTYVCLMVCMPVIYYFVFYYVVLKIEEIFLFK